jgi:hypothetical protein
VRISAAVPEFGAAAKSLSTQESESLELPKSAAVKFASKGTYRTDGPLAWTD